MGLRNPPIQTLGKWRFRLEPSPTTSKLGDRPRAPVGQRPCPLHGCHPAIPQGAAVTLGLVLSTGAPPDTAHLLRVFSLSLPPSNDLNQWCFLISFLSFHQASSLQLFPLMRPLTQEYELVALQAEPLLYSHCAFRIRPLTSDPSSWYPPGHFSYPCSGSFLPRLLSCIRPISCSSPPHLHCLASLTANILLYFSLIGTHGTSQWVYKDAPLFFSLSSLPFPNLLLPSSLCVCVCECARAQVCTPMLFISSSADEFHTSAIMMRAAMNTDERMC